MLFLFFPILAPSLLLMRPFTKLFTKVSTVRGDEVGEEGVEENGQEEWEGKVKTGFLITTAGIPLAFQDLGQPLWITIGIPQVKEAIDLAGQKSAAGRVKAVEALCTGNKSFV